MNTCARCGAPVVGPACARCGAPVDPHGFPVEPTAVEPQTWSGMAIASIVCSVLWLGCLGSVLGITFGIIGRREAEDPAKKGGGLATAGIALGIVGVLAMVGLGLATGSIGPADDGGRTKTSDTAATQPAPTPTTTVGTLGPISGAQASACRTESRTLQTSIEAFNAQYERLPASVGELIGVGFLSEEPTWYAFTVSGATYAVELTPEGVRQGCPAS